MYLFLLPCIFFYKYIGRSKEIDLMAKVSSRLMGVVIGPL
jgi:hypothetical protein